MAKARRSPKESKGKRGWAAPNRKAAASKTGKKKSTSKPLTREQVFDCREFIEQHLGRVFDADFREGLLFPLPISIPLVFLNLLSFNKPGHGKKWDQACSAFVNRVVTIRLALPTSSGLRLDGVRFFPVMDRESLEPSLFDCKEAIQIEPTLAALKSKWSTFSRSDFSSSAYLRCVDQFLATPKAMQARKKWEKLQQRAEKRDPWPAIEESQKKGFRVYVRARARAEEEERVEKAEKKIAEELEFIEESEKLRGPTLCGYIELTADGKFVRCESSAEVEDWNVRVDSKAATIRKRGSRWHARPWNPKLKNWKPEELLPPNIETEKDARRYANSLQYRVDRSFGIIAGSQSGSSWVCRKHASKEALEHQKRICALHKKLEKEGGKPVDRRRSTPEPIPADPSIDLEEIEKRVREASSDFGEVASWLDRWLAEVEMFVLVVGSIALNWWEREAKAQRTAYTTEGDAPELAEVAPEAKTKECTTSRSRREIKPSGSVLRRQLAECGNPSRVWSKYYEVAGVSKPTVYDWAKEYKINWRKYNTEKQDHLARKELPKPVDWQSAEYQKTRDRPEDLDREEQVLRGIKMFKTATRDRK